MTCLFVCLLIAVAVLGGFALGVIVGVSDCKRSYGIPKGVTPDEYTMTQGAMAYYALAHLEEEETDGCIYP